MNDVDSCFKGFEFQILKLEYVENNDDKKFSVQMTFKAPKSGPISHR